MGLQIKGLSHITFICKDLAKTTQIFKGVFGAEEVYCSGDQPFSIAKEKFLNVAGIRVALMEGEPVEKTYNMENKFVFKSLSFSDIPLMYDWFNQPHVQKFYSLRQWTEKEVLEKLTLYITGEKPVLGFIVLMGEDPIGYVQQYKISEQYEVSDYSWFDQNLSQAIVDNAAGMDLFIGNEKLIGKGFGSEIIKAFIESKLWSQFQYCVVDPDIRNISAIKCYEKLKFQDHAVIDTDNELGQSVKLKLMILKLKR